MKAKDQKEFKVFLPAISKNFFPMLSGELINLTQIGPSNRTVN